VSPLAYTDFIVPEGNYYCGRDGHEIDTIIVHTTVGTRDASIARFSNPANEVSAHWLVDFEGPLWRGVEEQFTAFHAGDWTENQRSIGIENVDNGFYDEPRPDALYATARELVAEIRARHPGITRLLAHRDVHATRCPDALDVARIYATSPTPTPVSTRIAGPSQATLAQLRSFLVSAEPSAPPGIAEAIWAASLELGIRAEVILAQQIKETGHYKYPHCGETVFNGCPDFNNFCGIKTADSSAIAKFPTMLEGCVGQAAHLRAYSAPDHMGPHCAKPFDPRHFDPHKNNAPNVEDLGGKWNSSADYGTSMLPTIAAILASPGGNTMAFDPRNNPQDLDFLDRRIREIVMAEDIAAFGIWTTLGRALGLKAVVAHPRAEAVRRELALDLMGERRPDIHMKGVPPRGHPASKEDAG